MSSLDQDARKAVSTAVADAERKAAGERKKLVQELADELRLHPVVVLVSSAAIAAIAASVLTYLLGH